MEPKRARVETPYERELARARTAPTGSSFSPAYATQLRRYEGASVGGATHTLACVPSRFVYPRGASSVAAGAFAIVEARANMFLGAPLKLSLAAPPKGEGGETSAPKHGHVDTYHFYVFLCVREPPAPPYRAPTYRVVETLCEHALPFDRPLLASMLCRELALSRKNAEALVRALPASCVAVSGALDLDALRDMDTEWFDDLFDSCAYFTLAHQQRLAAVWPSQALQRVPRQRLGELERSLQEGPLKFCFWWHSGFGPSLPELTAEQLVALAPARYSRQAGEEACLELACVRFYDFLKREAHQEAHLYASAAYAPHAARVAAFVGDARLREFAREHRLLAAVEHYGVWCVYAHGDLKLIARLRADMLAIARAPRIAAVRTRPRRASKYDVELSREQRGAVDAAIGARFYMISGGPGERALALCTSARISRARAQAWGRRRVRAPSTRTTRRARCCAARGRA